MSQKPSHNDTFKKWNACLLIPTYNNDQFLNQVIEDVLGYTDQVIIVNDGSTDSTTEILKTYEQSLTILHLSKNSGKGVALHEGFQKAIELGFEYALTMDSDGQHLASDIPAFFQVLDEEPGSLLLGARNMGQENVPGTSSFGHKFSNFWYKVMTGIELPDTQTGYRLYPLKPLSEIKFRTTKYEYEMEALVRLSWIGVKPVPVPINVYYPPQEERITHFRTVIDFTRISILNTFLVIIGLLWERPKQFFKSLKKKSPRQFWNEYILNTQESNTQITLAVMLGLFIGVSPLWGYQIVLIIFFCVLLKLNKVIALIAGHISIPPMIPLILYSSYKLGGIVLQRSTDDLNLEEGISFEAVKENLFQYVVGSFSLGVLLALVLGLLTYVILSLFRKKGTK